MSHLNVSFCCCGRNPRRGLPWFETKFARFGETQHPPYGYQSGGLAIPPFGGQRNPTQGGRKTAVLGVTFQHPHRKKGFAPWSFGDTPVVLTVDEAETCCEAIDATGWEPDRLREALAWRARHTFDIAAELPLTACLYRCGDDEHVLALVLHHIAVDGWSLAPLAADLRRPTAVEVSGTPRLGNRCLSSTSITPCGKGATWVTRPMTTA